jgi:hypothetical protein
MTLSRVNDSKHWRERAAQMRALSAMMRDSDVVTAMLRLAEERASTNRRLNVVASVSMPKLFRTLLGTRRINSRQ